jgi:HlyD family secretion protein
MKINRKVAVLVLAGGLLLAGGGWLAWKLSMSDTLPPGIVSANGRVEANQVEIATKIAGRVTEIVPHEGDTVEAGSMVARLDQAEIDAQLRQAEAEAQSAQERIAAAQAALASRKGDLTFAEQEFKRTTALIARGFISKERLDQSQQQLTTAKAALNAANAQVNEARAALAAANAQADRIKTVVGDTTIKSPIRGRVQYRLVEPGAVLPAGGRIVTLLDLSDVSMTIFLPAREAGRLAIGDEARVVLDAAPEYVFPTTVSFVAAEAQFTPKTVETSSERDKLMFRVKLQAPAAMLKTLEARVKSGLRGTAYVRVDRTATWPDRLAVKLPQ